MNTTTVTRPVENDQLSVTTSSPTRSNRRQRAGAVAVSLALAGGAAFLVAQMTTAHHATTDKVSPKLSFANAALITGDVAPVTREVSPANRTLIASEVSPSRQLSPADRTLIASEVAPVTLQVSPANRAQIVGDSARVTLQMSAADRAQIAH